MDGLTYEEYQFHTLSCYGRLQEIIFSWAVLWLYIIHFHDLSPYRPLQKSLRPIFRENCIPNTHHHFLMAPHLLYLFLALKTLDSRIVSILIPVWSYWRLSMIILLIFKEPSPKKPDIIISFFFIIRTFLERFLIYP